jgi:hypothetical protein
MAEPGLEFAAEERERRVIQMQGLQDDCCSSLELGGDALDVRDTRERSRPPRKVARVVGRIQLGARLDEPERGVAKRAGANEPLDVSLRQ